LVFLEVLSTPPDASKPGVGERLRLGPSTTVMGFDVECDLKTDRLCAGLSHASFAWRDDAWCVRAGARHGLHVNGRPVKESRLPIST